MLVKFNLPQSVLFYRFLICSFGEELGISNTHLSQEILFYTIMTTKSVAVSPKKPTLDDEPGVLGHHNH